MAIALPREQSDAHERPPLMTTRGCLRASHRGGTNAAAVYRLLPRCCQGNTEALFRHEDAKGRPAKVLRECFMQSARTHKPCQAGAQQGMGCWTLRGIQLTEATIGSARSSHSLAGLREDPADASAGRSVRRLLHGGVTVPTTYRLQGTSRLPAIKRSIADPLPQGSTRTRE
jgi:hypothetical protein